VQRGNVKLSNLEVLNEILHVVEQGRKWRGLLDAVFDLLQREQIVVVRIQAVSLDSTTVKVYPKMRGLFRVLGPERQVPTPHIEVF